MVREVRVLLQLSLRHLHQSFLQLHFHLHRLRAHGDGDDGVFQKLRFHLLLLGFHLNFHFLEWALVPLARLGAHLDDGDRGLRDDDDGAQHFQRFLQLIQNSQQLAWPLLVQLS